MKVLNIISVFLLSQSHVFAQTLEIKHPQNIAELVKTSGEIVRELKPSEQFKIENVEYIELRSGKFIYQEELNPLKPELDLENQLRERLLEELSNSNNFIIRSGTDSGGG